MNLDGRKYGPFSSRTLFLPINEPTNHSGFRGRLFCYFCNDSYVFSSRRSRVFCICEWRCQFIELQSSGEYLAVKWLFISNSICDAILMLFCSCHKWTQARITLKKRELYLVLVLHGVITSAQSSRLYKMMIPKVTVCTSLWKLWHYPTIFHMRCGTNYPYLLLHLMPWRNTNIVWDLLRGLLWLIMLAYVRH